MKDMNSEIWKQKKNAIVEGIRKVTVKPNSYVKYRGITNHYCESKKRSHD